VQILAGIYVFMGLVATGQLLELVSFDWHITLHMGWSSNSCFAALLLAALLLLQ
jgi:hypothetical protein